MLYLIVTLFALAAVMGLIIAAAIFNKKPATPKPAVVAHGIFGASALGLLIYYAMQHRGAYPQVSLILFVIAALGGFLLLYNDLKKKPGPFSVVIVHALVAVTAFVLLLAFVLF
jgi:hypothetical protein